MKYVKRSKRKSVTMFAGIERQNVGQIKIPTGNESGVSNTKWIPGGKTSGGVWEGIVDLKVESLEFDEL